MSASREKKQRQDVGLDPKAAKAQKEQAEKKRKTVIYSVIGVIAAVAVAALLIWHSGFFQARMTAATVGGEKLSVAEMDYFYYTARTYYLQRYYSTYAAMGYPIPADTDVMDEDTGTTYHDYYLETAKTNASQITALYNEAVSKGYSVNDVKDDVKSELDGIKSSASANGVSYATYLRGTYGSHMSSGVLEKMIGRELVASKYYSDRNAELKNSYTQNDLDKYLEENHDTLDTFEYSTFYVAAATVETEDKDGNEIDEETVNKQKEEAMEQAKADAEEILLEFTDADEFDHLVEEFGLTATSCQNHVVNTGSSINAAYVYYDELMDLKEGESAVVEATNGYYAIVLHSRTLDTSPARNTRHILINAETGTDDNGATVAPTDEAWNAALEKIESIKAEYEAGDKTEDSFAALAEKYSDDGGSNTNGGLYENVEKGQFVSEFEDWLFDDARKPGDVSDPVAHGKDASSSNYYGYHLIYYVGEGDVITWQRKAREALAGADLTTWLEQLSSACPIAMTDVGNSSVGV